MTTTNSSGQAQTLCTGPISESETKTLSSNLQESKLPILPSISPHGQAQVSRNGPISEASSRGRTPRHVKQPNHPLQGQKVTLSNLNFLWQKDLKNWGSTLAALFKNHRRAGTGVNSPQALSAGLPKNVAPPFSVPSPFLNALGTLSEMQPQTNGISSPRYGPRRGARGWASGATNPTSRTPLLHRYGAQQPPRERSPERATALSFLCSAIHPLGCAKASESLLGSLRRARADPRADSIHLVYQLPKLVICCAVEKEAAEELPDSMDREISSTSPPTTTERTRGRTLARGRLQADELASWQQRERSLERNGERSARTSEPRVTDQSTSDLVSGSAALSTARGFAFGYAPAPRPTSIPLLEPRPDSFPPEQMDCSEESERLDSSRARAQRQQQVHSLELANIDRRALFLRQQINQQQASNALQQDRRDTARTSFLNSRSSAHYLQLKQHSETLQQGQASLRHIQSQLDTVLLVARTMSSHGIASPTNNVSEAPLAAHALLILPLDEYTLQMHACTVDNATCPEPAPPTRMRQRTQLVPTPPWLRKARPPSSSGESKHPLLQLTRTLRLLPVVIQHLSELSIEDKPAAPPAPRKAQRPPPGPSVTSPNTRAAPEIASTLVKETTGLLRDQALETKAVCAIAKNTRVGPAVEMGVGERKQGGPASGIKAGGQENGGSGSRDCQPDVGRVRGSVDESTTRGTADGGSTGDSAGGRGDDGRSGAGRPEACHGGEGGEEGPEGSHGGGRLRLQGKRPLLNGTDEQSHRGTTGGTARGIGAGGREARGRVDCFSVEGGANGSAGGSTAGGPADEGRTDDSAGGGGDGGRPATGPTARSGGGGGEPAGGDGRMGPQDEWPLLPGTTTTPPDQGERPDPRSQGGPTETGKDFSEVGKDRVRPWVKVAQDPPVPKSIHTYLTRHPEATLTALKEIATKTGSASPSTLRFDGLADRLKSVPSLVMRFWLTAKDLGLPGLTNRWKTIASLKDRTAELFLKLLDKLNLGSGLDPLARQSTTVRIPGIPEGGLTDDTRIDIEITLPPSNGRDNFIRLPYRSLSTRAESDPHSATGVLVSHPVHESRRELPLPAQSSNTILELAATMGIKDSDHQAVALLACRILELETGLSEVFARVRCQHSPTGDGATVTKTLMLCIDSAAFPNLPPSVHVPGAIIHLPQLSASDVRSLTMSLFAQGQIAASDTSPLVLLGPMLPTQTRDKAIAMDTARNMKRELQAAYPDSDVIILMAAGQSPHGALLSFPTEQHAAQMRANFSLRNLPSLQEVWDRDGSLCVGMAGPVKCLQVLTADQLDTLALRCGRTPPPRQHRPRDRVFRGAPTPAPRTPGPRPGPGPDNPSRTPR